MEWLSSAQQLFIYWMTDWSTEYMKLLIQETFFFSLVISFICLCCLGSSPGRPSGGRPPYPPYPPGGGSNMGPSNPPYHVPNHASYPPSTQPSYSGPAASIPHVTQANLDTTNSPTAVSSTLKDEEIKLSLRSAVEDKIRRSTKALFQQAQVYIIRFELTVDC